MVKLAECMCNVHDCDFKNGRAFVGIWQQRQSLHYVSFH